MTRSRMIQRLLASVFFLGTLAHPAFAQLDPKLQVTATDFLDLFQKSANLSAKPEIGTVFDFSGSMNRMMFHASYPNQAGDDDLYGNRTDSSYVNVVAQISKSAGVYSLTGLMLDNTNTTSPIAVGTTFTLTISSGKGGGVYTFTGLGLVRPDGQYVTAADADAASVAPLTANDPTGVAGFIVGRPYGSKDVRNWIRAASHARFSCKSPGGITRVIDLPLNWAVLPNGTNAPLPTTYPINPLPRLTVKDTKPTTPVTYDFDTTYLGASGSNTMLGVLGSTNTDGGFSTGRVGNTGSNVMLFRTRYLEWVYFGVNSSGNRAIQDIFGATTLVSSLAATAYPTNPVSGVVVGPFTNTIPNTNRIQAVKIAAIKTWLNYQDKVFWAFRILGYKLTSSSASPAPTPIPGGAITSDVNGDTYPNGGTTNDSSSDQSWYLLNGDSDNGIKAISKCVATTGTPLTTTTATELMQFQDGSIPFSRVETTYNTAVGADNSNAVYECTKHFFILFTDGVPNESPSPVETYPSAFPYISSASAGNALVVPNLSKLDSGGGYWNTMTLAAAAAHLGDTANGGMALPGAAYSGSNPSNYAPFAVLSRKLRNIPIPPATLPAVFMSNYQFTTWHPVQTMTVGINLGENWATPSPNPINPYTNPSKPIATDVTAPKFRLLASATAGDPLRITWDISTVQPYPTDGSIPGVNNVFYFDGRSPDAIVTGLGIAFASAIAISNLNETSTPTTPFVGLGLANQIYLGTFLPPSSGGPIWGGDLRMYATKTNPDSSTSLVDSSLTAISTPDATNSQWNASDIFTVKGANRQWYNRNVWTRLPGTGAAPNPGLIPFTDATGTLFDAVKTSFAIGLNSAVTPPTVDAQKQALLQTLLGAKSGVGGARTSIPNADSVMRDIINSSPTVAEYDLNDASLVAALKTASPYLGGKLGSPISPDMHFRVIFVGDNLGFLHAFGELAINKLSIPANPASPKVTTGWVDELWAYYPTDFLQNADYYLTFTNPHRFAVDGSPLVYHLDLPQGTAISGDGKVNNGEKAVLVFGLRKGGRSYYALDISNPLVPKLGPNGTNAAVTNLGWALVPDESATFDSARIETGATPASVTAIIGKMGFSSCIPAVGRVIFGSPQVFRDAIFLGGGYSTPDVEKAFNAVTPPLLGRSVIALDAIKGSIMGMWDLSGISGMGPVPAGVIPFEFFANTGLAQRAYFSDLFGGLWALGSQQQLTGTFAKFRSDSSALDQWTDDGTRKPASLAVRPVYRQAVSPAVSNNGLLSTLPAPFRIGNYPATRGSDPKVAPAAVGIALESGDRNNPLDRNYTTLNLKPTQHRITVVFDRQDSNKLGLDSSGTTDTQLQDMSSQGTENAPIITPGDPAFYLNDTNGKYGYFANFPTATAPFVSKGISQPIVLSYVLLYSYFSPKSSDPCTGGSGETISTRVCNVLFPVITSTKVSAVSPVCASGSVFTWTGVASDFTAKSNIVALQGGMSVPAGSPSGTKAVVSLQTITGNQGGRFPKPRVWRVVH